MTDTLIDLLADIRRVAREHGYAVGLHGSQARDLDLMAVPWVEECSTPDEFVKALEVNLNLVAIRRSVEKPHGRLGYILYGRRWRTDHEPQPIDLSVLRANS